MSRPRFAHQDPPWNTLKALHRAAQIEGNRHPLSDAERFEPQSAQNDKAGPDHGPDGKNACNRPVGSDRGIVGVGE